MKRSRQLFVEQLEDRCVLTTWGNPWPDAPHLTVSFAPDGTQVGDRVSALFRTLDTQMPTAVWQREVLRALQTWAVNANINIGLVGDGGQPFGTTGPVQGDARFGDVRVAAYLMSPEVLALASPVESTSGTWSGDLKLNSGYRFSTGGGPGLDLYSVILHEAGHVFGLAHSNDPSSPLYEKYLGPRSGLSMGDILQLQALYGVRTPDAYEGKSGNDSFASATSFLLPNSTNGTIGLTMDGDVTTTADRDFYSFKTLLNPGGVLVQLQTEGVSLLNARLTVYDAAKNVVATAVATDPLGGDLALHLSKVKLLSTYYIKVESATGDVFGVGSYRLQVNFLPGLQLPTDQLLGLVTGTTTTLLNLDLHTNDTFLTALNLGQLLQQADSRFDFVFKGSISDSRDVDFYRLRAPSAAAGSANVMTAMIWGLEANGLDPRVTVYDQYQRPVAAEVLVSEGGTYTVQIANAVAGATYYVKVSAARPQGGHNVGNYFLGVDFGGQAVQLESMASGTLSAARPQAERVLHVGRSQLFHFVLSADSGVAGASVRMTVQDRRGNVVFTLTAAAGETMTGNAYLPRGDYLVRFTATTPAGTSLIYHLRGIVLDDPVGPRPEDPTSDPAGDPGSGGDSGDYYYGDYGGYYYPGGYGGYYDGGTSPSFGNDYGGDYGGGTTPSLGADYGGNHDGGMGGDYGGGGNGTDPYGPPPADESDWWWYTPEPATEPEDPYFDRWW